jgi:hypothetical protein
MNACLAIPNFIPLQDGFLKAGLTAFSSQVGDLLARL